MNGRKKIILLAGYILSLAAILWLPADMVRRIEWPVEPPAEIKFKVTVADPYDPMRGRYVLLHPLPDSMVAKERVSRFRWREKAYAVIRKGPGGFAEVIRLEKSTDAIAPGERYVRVSNVWLHAPYRKGATYSYRFQLPFRRFYLNELKAPELEAELRNRSAARQYMILSVKFFKGGFYAVSGLSRPEKKTGK